MGANGLVIVPLVPLVPLVALSAWLLARWLVVWVERPDQRHARQVEAWERIYQRTTGEQR